MSRAEAPARWWTSRLLEAADRTVQRQVPPVSELVDRAGALQDQEVVDAQQRQDRPGQASDRLP